MGSISWNTAWCSSVCSQCWSSSLCARNKQAAILEIKTTEQTMAGITATDQTSAVCSTDHCWNCPDSAQSLCSLMMMLCHLINLELTNNLTLGHQYQLSPTHQPCLLINLEPTNNNISGLSSNMFLTPASTLVLLPRLTFLQDLFQPLL